MTRITATAAAIGALMAGAAAADTVIVFDDAREARFEAKRAVVDAVQAEFGETAAYGDQEALPASIADAIKPGAMMPEGVETSAPPASVGALPHLVPNSEWVAAGNHLAEVDQDGRIVMVVYDVLP